MKREFLLNLLFLLAINLLVKPIYIFGVDRGFQNAVGQDEYGVFAVLLSFSYILQTINDFGIQNFNNRNISQHPKLIHKFFPNIISLKIGLSVLYMILTLSVGLLLGYTGFSFRLLVWLAGNQILVTMILYFRSNISGLQYYRWDSFLSSLDRILMLLIGFYLLWVPGKADGVQIEWLVYAQTAAYAITLVVAVLVLLPRMGRIRFRLNPALMLLLLKRSFPYAVLIFLMSMYTRVDQVMLFRLLPDGASQVGIYAAAYRLLDASNMIGFLFAGLLLPMFAFMLGQKQEIGSLVKTGFSAVLILSIGVAFYCFFFREALMTLLYDEATEYWSAVLGVLMFSFIAVSGSYIFGTLLTADGQLKVLNYISFGGLVVNVALNFVMILKFKALGAAWVTTITQSFVFSAQIWWCYRNYELGIGLKFCIQVLIYGLSLAFAGWLLQHFNADLLQGTLLFMVAGGIAALGTRLLDIQQILQLFLRKQQR
ncbi:MAG: oligosaccharide flippase family protein [Bacteroidota bacterium]